MIKYLPDNPINGLIIIPSICRIRENYRPSVWNIHKFIGICHQQNLLIHSLSANVPFSRVWTIFNIQSITDLINHHPEISFNGRDREVQTVIIGSILLFATDCNLVTKHQHQMNDKANSSIDIFVKSVKYMDWYIFLICPVNQSEQYRYSVNTNRHGMHFI